jgi:maltooligosyltrehalose trehalohydrolase
MDGLRIDGTQAMHDTSPTHILSELSRRVRAAAHPRHVLLVGENEPQDVRALQPVEHGGWGLDAVWCDDFHHSARVALTGRHDGYHGDHRGSAQEFISAARHGFLFQGQCYQWQGKPRGTPALGRDPASFAHYLQNHDQVANTLCGQRLSAITSPAGLRAATALLLLGPQTPMLFMGQEFGASSPFCFFADAPVGQDAGAWEARRASVAQFASHADPAAQALVPDPADEQSFLRCKLDFGERARRGPLLALHRDLLRLRRQDRPPGGPPASGADGAVLGERALVLRWRAAAGERLLLVNLGAELDFRPAPEPLLAPPADQRWQPAWSSDDIAYGGPGIAPVQQDGGWRLPGASATLLHAVPLHPEGTP